MKKVTFYTVSGQPKGTYFNSALEDMSGSYIPAAVGEQMLEALKEVYPLMIPGMNWTDETGQLVKNAVGLAISKAEGGAS